MADFSFKNTQSRPITVWIEPWAHDYTLLLGECLELTFVQDSNAEPSWLHLELDHKDLMIYIERGACDFEVKVNGALVECGYQRGLGHQAQ